MLERLVLQELKWFSAVTAPPKFVHKKDRYKVIKRLRDIFCLWSRDAGNIFLSFHILQVHICEPFSFYSVSVEKVLQSVTKERAIEWF